MPEERPQEHDGPQPDDAAGETPANADESAGSGEDPTSEALDAAKEALSNIQAEADAAIGGASGSEPGSAGDGSGETVADSVVQAALKAAQQSGGKLELPKFDLSSVSGVQHGLDLLADVQLDVRIELGRTRMLVE